ncbi:MAG: hypothetical protein Q4D62_11930 [Planctomycetia bacterium]|nr:hypothetical protein [Planctomycetia bacterium]
MFLFLQKKTPSHFYRRKPGGRSFFLLACVVSLLWLAGCQSSFQRPKPETDDPFNTQTEEMRQDVGRVKHQQPATGVVYGGMSNEAKAIEDSLYGK